MFVQAISPPIELMDYLHGFYYHTECYLFTRPMFRLSIALKSVARELPSGIAAFQLAPMLREMSAHQLEGLASLGGVYIDPFNSFGSGQNIAERITELIDTGALVVHSVPEYYYNRLNDYNDIFFKPLSNSLSDLDPILNSTDALWQTLGGSADAPPETDLTLPPLKFPALQKLGAVEVDLSAQAIYTRSDIVPQKLGLHQVKDNDALCQEVERLGCSAHLARTALDRGLNRWQVLSDYKYGRQLLNFFWMQTDERARHLLVKRNTEEPSYVFRLPAEVFLALGAVGFKNMRGITDPRVRVGPFNIKAIEAMADLSDRLTQQAAIAAAEAEALRDDVGPQSRSASIWADLPPNHYVQLRVKDRAGRAVENQRWWVQTPDGRVHSGRTNLHGVGRVSGLSKLGPCQIKFPGALVVREGKGSAAGLGLEGAVFTEQVNGEYTFIVTPTHWVTAILRDAEGAPVANEAWWIKTPDGVEHTGTTDAEGVARIKNSGAPGRCDIRFTSVPVLKDGCISPPPNNATAGTYVVQQGDTLLRIAKAHGLSNAAEIYDHPENDAFRTLRPNPDLIYPGDEIVLPAKNENPFNAAMDVEHEFVVSQPAELCKFTLLDEDDEPYVGKRAVLRVGDQSVEQILGEDGQIGISLQGLDETTGEIELYVHEDLDEEPLKFTVSLAYMDPVDTLSGVQARCNNLGFDCGVVDGVMGRKTREGISGFQSEYGLSVDGVPGPQTQQRLAEVYGS